MRGPRGVVLAGGGARGAYEAGVMCALLERMALHPSPRLEFVCGTSVGAIHAAVVAAGVRDPRALARELELSWGALKLNDVLQLGPATLTRLRPILLGGARGGGLLEARPLIRLIHRLVPPAGIAAALRSGQVEAVTVSTTHVPTGQPIVFVDGAPHVSLPRHVGRHVRVVEARIGLRHLLASASIPMLFPPVLIGDDLHVDGGLRLNTPIGPAVRLGAERVLVVGLSDVRDDDSPLELAHGRHPGASFLMGKLLDAFLLDHVMADLDELERINRMILRGTEIYGDDYGARMRAASSRQGEPSYHVVTPLVIRPSVDLGEIAATHLSRTARLVGTGGLAWSVLRALQTGEGGGAGLTSYLLFDGAFARDLIELGRKDAMAKVDELDAFVA